MSSPIPDRRDYHLATLDESQLLEDPLELFGDWFKAAVAAGLNEPNAMVLATADATGRPSARVVLLKGFDDRGFCFFTNLTSRKGQELSVNPFAALVFHWQEMERQVRIEGRVESVRDEESDAYFQSRPASARLGAWASEQSREIPDRRALESRLEYFERLYGQTEIPRPRHWGGLRVVPDAIEFWQGRPSRLHDRFLYTRDTSGRWRHRRLAP